MKLALCVVLMQENTLIMVAFHATAARPSSGTPTKLGDVILTLILFHQASSEGQCLQ